MIRTWMVLAASAAFASCAQAPDKNATFSVAAEAPVAPQGADPAPFNLVVNSVFERRCGSIDCHGNTARGLRIYSALGLRLPNDAGIAPGVGETTLEEVSANYASVLALQPEKMRDFLSKSPRTPDDAYQLLILSKPLGPTQGGERHKGGAALGRGDAAEQCIVTWLIGTTDQAKCSLGSKPP